MPIALDGTDGLPARSIVAISGLPQGSALSNGRPYGETEWTLKPDEIGDLHLDLPNTARGESKLAIKLIAPDDKVVADTETVLNVAANPKGYLEQAVEADSGDAELALGAIQEPNLAGVGLQEIEPKPAVAQNGYDGATEPGTTGTEGRFANLNLPKETSGAQSPPESSTQANSGEDRSNWVEPSAFVNLRGGPSSSAPVVSVVAKGAKLVAIGRKRGWVQVTNPANSEKGWIYSGNLAGATNTRPLAKRAAHAAAPSGSDSSLVRFGPVAVESLAL